MLRLFIVLMALVGACIIIRAFYVAIIMLMVIALIWTPYLLICKLTKKSA